MPLYEYECDVNGHRFELIRKFSDPPLESCPQCGSPVHKLFSSPAIQFKGSGFYITDYAKGESGPPKSSGGKDMDSGGSDKTETAPKSESTATPSPAPGGDQGSKGAAPKDAPSKDTAKKDPPKKDPPKKDAVKNDG